MLSKTALLLLAILILLLLIVITCYFTFVYHKNKTWLIQQRHLKRLKHNYRICDTCKYAHSSNRRNKPLPTNVIYCNHHNCSKFNIDYCSAWQSIPLPANIEINRTSFYLTIYKLKNIFKHKLL